MTKEYVLSRLCVYDKKNPDYIPYDEDDESIKPTDCSCDNCFYGRTILSEKILQLNQALEDNKDKKYTENDLKKIIEWLNKNYSKVEDELARPYEDKGEDLYDGFFKDAYEEALKRAINSIQPKTEWEVEIVDGKLKLAEISVSHKLPDLTWKDASKEEIKSKELKSMKGKRL